MAGVTSGRGRPTAALGPGGEQPENACASVGDADRSAELAARSRPMLSDDPVLLGEKGADSGKEEIVAENDRHHVQFWVDGQRGRSSAGLGARAHEELEGAGVSE